MCIHYICHFILNYKCEQLYSQDRYGTFAPSGTDLLPMPFIHIDSVKSCLKYFLFVYNYTLIIIVSLGNDVWLALGLRIAYYICKPVKPYICSESAIRCGTM